jgi:thiamine-monophosphate kinase
MDELQIIDWLKNNVKARSRNVKIGIGDDAAVVNIPGEKYLILTTDIVVDGVHFHLKKVSPEKIGRKALAVNISDIAAMGGKPLYALVSLGLPEQCTGLVPRIYRGILGIAKEFNVDVIGGNLSRSAVLFVDIFLVGTASKNRVFLRSTAKPGDMIFVTGSLGGSIEGKHLTFKPRVKEAQLLIHAVRPTAMMDLSDGLGADLSRIAAASGSGFEIIAGEIPVSDALKKKALSFDERISRALYDGEDYELLFTVRPSDAAAVPAQLAGVPVSCIGRITRTRRNTIVMPDGSRKKIEKKEFQHFRRLNQN